MERWVSKSLETLTAVGRKAQQRRQQPPWILHYWLLRRSQEHGKKALNMMVDPNNHTRWKHKWRWHHRECVWDKVVSEWAGAEDGMDKRIMCE